MRFLGIVPNFLTGNDSAAVSCLCSVEFNGEMSELVEKTLGRVFTLLPVVANLPARMTRWLMVAHRSSSLSDKALDGSVCSLYELAVGRCVGWSLPPWSLSRARRSVSDLTSDVGPVTTTSGHSGLLVGDVTGESSMLLSHDALPLYHVVVVVVLAAADAAADDDVTMTSQSRRLVSYPPHVVQVYQHTETTRCTVNIRDRAPSPLCRLLHSYPAFNSTPLASRLY